MAKKRIEIPEKLAAETMFESDGICCVCRNLDRYAAVQIHHIDENPANNKKSNFAVLCLDCHNRTQLHGGFGRHLNAAQVTQYRDDWLLWVRRSRGESISGEFLDRMRARWNSDLEAQTGVSFEDFFTRIEEQKKKAFDELMTQKTERGDLARKLMELPQRHRDLYVKSQQKWDSGVTATMVQGNYDLTNGLVQIMEELLPYFAKGPFAERGSDYIHERIRAAYEWFRGCEDTKWNTGRGTIKNTIITGKVTGIAEDLLKSMVSSFGEDLLGFDYLRWERDWNRASN